MAGLSFYDSQSLRYLQQESIKVAKLHKILNPPWLYEINKHVRHYEQMRKWCEFHNSQALLNSQVDILRDFGIAIPKEKASLFTAISIWSNVTIARMSLYVKGILSNPDNHAILIWLIVNFLKFFLR